ncbi:unnamed protein product [Amoebophrya sp. A120]|nr:unnamed protein product [Amoebophrya sp. A120]|eukprot:GSA120T00019499001.1
MFRRECHDSLRRTEEEPAGMKTALRKTSKTRKLPLKNTFGTATPWRKIYFGTESARLRINVGTRVAALRICKKIETAQHYFLTTAGGNVSIITLLPMKFLFRTSTFENRYDGRSLALPVLCKST